MAVGSSKTMHLGSMAIAPDLRAGNAQILRPKGYILLHHVGNDLIVRILEHHTNISPHRHQPVRVGGIQSADINLSAGGE